MAGEHEYTFACDAMLGGVARWLRAAGYDASWHAGIGDWDLVRLAIQEGRTLLTSDSGIFRIGIVRDGDVPALFLPAGLSKHAQLAMVLQKLNLVPREPRCMACGGPLEELPAEQARNRVPPRTFAWLNYFYECQRCCKIFWQGTHWQKIAAILQQVRTARPPEANR